MPTSTWFRIVCLLLAVSLAGGCTYTTTCVRTLENQCLSRQEVEAAMARGDVAFLSQHFQVVPVATPSVSQRALEIFVQPSSTPGDFPNIRVGAGPMRPGGIPPQELVSRGQLLAELPTRLLGQVKGWKKGKLVWTKGWLQKGETVIIVPFPDETGRAVLDEHGRLRYRIFAVQRCGNEARGFAPLWVGLPSRLLQQAFIIPIEIREEIDWVKTGLLIGGAVVAAGLIGYHLRGDDTRTIRQDCPDCKPKPKPPPPPPKPKPPQPPPPTPPPPKPPPPPPPPPPTCPPGPGPAPRPPVP